MNRKVIPLILIVAGILVTMGKGYSFSLALQKRSNKLVIYTYESLLAWGDDPSAVNDSVFGQFAREHGIDIDIVYFDDARSALLAAIKQKGTLAAPDIVIGIDNILVHEALSAGIFVNFTPANLSRVNNTLIELLDPTLHVIPYDYGAIVPVVREDLYPENSTPSPLNWTLDDLASVASKMITEDPTISTPGLGFLLTEIALETKIMNRDWKTWWYNVKEKIRVAPSWGTAYDEFLSGKERAIVISYGTDSAYAYHFEGKISYKPYPIWANGTPWVWLQVEGLGVVAGSPNEELAKEFVGWFLSDEVQSLIPLNNWMYPATNVSLPDDYKYALNMSTVQIANELLSSEEIENSLNTWLEEWKGVMTNDWTSILIIIALVGTISAIIVILILKKKHLI